MPVDHRIYSQMQAPDILGSVQRGLSMREMIDQRANQKKQMAEQEQIKQAYAKNLIQGENGSVSYNRGGLMSDLVKSGAGREAMAMQDRFSQADARERKIANEQDLKEMEMFARIAPSIKDQISFEKGKQFLEQRGIDTSKLGNVYDKGIVDRYAMGVTSYLDQMKLKNQERQFRQKDREIALKEKELNTKSMLAKQKSEKKTKLSPTEAKQKGLYELGVEAEKQFRMAVSDPNNYDPTQTGQLIDNSEWAPNFLKNDKAIEAQAAQANWVEAFLRDASGAAIPPSERMAYAQDFFPAPGDTPAVVENKRQLRERKMENARIAAGGDRTTPRAPLGPEQEAERRRSRIAELRAKLGKNQVAGQ